MRHPPVLTVSRWVEYSKRSLSAPRKSPKESQSPNQFLAFRLPVDICVHLRSRMCPASSATCTLNLTLQCIVDYLDILSRSAPSANAENSECSSYSTWIAKHSVRSVETPSAIVTTPIIDDKSWATHARPINQPINQPTNQPINQPTNQSTTIDHQQRQQSA